MKDLRIEQTVEILCEKGCQSVREDIKKLENKHQLTETADLSQQQVREVLEELKSIMSVYGDNCSIDGAVEMNHRLISDTPESASGN